MTCVSAHSHLGNLKRVELVPPQILSTDFVKRAYVGKV